MSENESPDQPDTTILRIGYKSGNVVDIPVLSFTLHKAGAELMGVDWHTPDGAKIVPKFLGVDSIEFIYEVFAPEAQP